MAPEEQIAELREEVNALRMRVAALESFPAELLQEFQKQLATPTTSQDVPLPASRDSQVDAVFGDGSTAGGVSG